MYAVKGDHLEVMEALIAREKIRDYQVCNKVLINTPLNLVSYVHIWNLH